ncbi:hypothetical protein [Streptomyces sp. NPDC004134]|uniref:hypothetical protein n=1 Tax=Streptomyces sp. NPDC004134 TaxID=3364691 RepID=UPI0036C38310
MKAVRNGVKASLLCALTAFTAFFSMGMSTANAASATELNGSWGPFTRCPVDDPRMLAADGDDFVAQCVSSASASGSIKLGNSEVTAGNSNLQFGLVQNTSAGTFEVVPPKGGALVADPATVPGGLLGLMCPSDIPVVGKICDSITNSDLNRITATMESAGSPSDFDLLAGATTGRPIVTLPVRIHLENPLLADSCYIGSASKPVVLHPANLTQPSFGATRFDSDGTPNPAPDAAMTRVELPGADQGDSAFSVPGATGCGLLGLIDLAVNLKTGLPSASGNNDLVLNDASTYMAALTAPGLVVPDNGKLLSQYWHSAVR